MSISALNPIGLTAMRADPRFSAIDGQGLSVAVIDTGLDASHTLLDDNYVTGFDFITGSGTPTDTDGHGTRVAGIVGAEDPDIGVAPEVGLIGLGVFTDRGAP